MWHGALFSHKWYRKLAVETLPYWTANRVVMWHGALLPWICTILDCVWEGWVHFLAFFFFKSVSQVVITKKLGAGKHCLPEQMGLKGLSTIAYFEDLIHNPPVLHSVATLQLVDQTWWTLFRLCAPNINCGILIGCSCSSDWQPGY